MNHETDCRHAQPHVGQRARLQHDSRDGVGGEGEGHEGACDYRARAGHAGQLRIVLFYEFGRASARNVRRGDVVRHRGQHREPAGRAGLVRGCFKGLGHRGGEHAHAMFWRGAHGGRGDGRVFGGNEASVREHHRAPGRREVPDGL